MQWTCLVVIVAVVGCGSTPNPLSCLDGSCTDPQYPYCDVEGFFEEPGTCIAVTCTAGEFKGCRDDRAITCNATGNNFDLVDCPNGCDENGCIPPSQIDCTTNAQCSNPAPICGGDMTCRGCAGNDECSSTVCETDTGACTAESAIVYASPTGSTTSDCTLTEPCTLARASQQAAIAIGKTLRLLPGNYTDNFAIAGNVIVKVVATGATLAGTATMTVTGGATVDLRDLAITTAGTSTLTCGDVSVAVAKSTLRLSGVEAGLRIHRCSVTMVGGTLRGLSTTDDASLDADRVSVRYGFAGTNGSRLSLRFTNSVFHDNMVSLGNFDSAAPGSKLSVAFSTFVFTTASNYFICNTNASNYIRTETFENNIFLALPSTSSNTSVLPRTCVFSNNIMFPQNAPIGGNPVVDPKLVDVAAEDYRLKADSPALNAGLPSASLTTNHDFDGVARPQGAAHDIGAFERAP